MDRWVVGSGFGFELVGGFSFGFWWLGFVLIWRLGMVLGDQWFVVVAGYGFAGVCFEFGGWVWCWGWVLVLMMAGWWQRQ